MSKGKILFQLSGSIACFKACQLLSRVVQAGYDVEVVATRAALEFVGEATLEGLTGRKVHTDTFARGEYMNHIHLMRWADLVLLCPATANTLNKMVAGIGDDLLTTLFLAHDFKKPYLVAPAMNVTMLRHPSTSASITRLRKWGVEFVDGTSGSLACGEIGEGRLPEPETVFAAIEKHFVAVLPLKILITSGGTREKIDGVRSITNTSTGRTGATIADYFVSRGHSVTFLKAQGSAPSIAKSFEFTSFGDLSAALDRELSGCSFDAVIHAAAVSDYSVDELIANGKRVERSGKIDSGESLEIHLKRNPKLIDTLRAKNPSAKIVAFKLTDSVSTDERTAAVKKLAERSHPDFIVHNDLHEISSDSHLTSVYSAHTTLQKIAQASTKLELAQTLEKLLTASETTR